MKRSDTCHGKLYQICELIAEYNGQDSSENQYSSIFPTKLPYDERKDDIREGYEVLLNELREYNPELLVKDRVLAITKSDMLDEQLKEEIAAQLPEDIPHVFISSFTQEGISELKNMLWDALQSDNNEQTIAEIVVPELPDVTDHPYYQQFNSNDEEEE